MAAFEDELLAAAKHLIRRKVGQKGKIPSARIRRSVSTTYYALFHFLLDETGRLVVGATNDVKTRRRLLSRTISHKSVKTALDRVKGNIVDQVFAEFFSYKGAVGVPPSPRFARNMAKAFSDAQAKRHDADYNLQATLSAHDANLLQRRVRRTIQEWRAAKSLADRDFKKAICLAILIKGQLRSENF
ncbi:MAG: hypothetical protein K2W91_13620 [Novosphingobium sp.]|nr:hypothetical protein [Novosphingobium sp.]